MKGTSTLSIATKQQHSTTAWTEPGESVKFEMCYSFVSPVPTSHQYMELLLQASRFALFSASSDFYLRGDFWINAFSLNTVCLKICATPRYLKSIQGGVKFQ